MMHIVEGIFKRHFFGLFKGTRTPTKPKIAIPKRKRGEGELQVYLAKKKQYKDAYATYNQEIEVATFPTLT